MDKQEIREFLLSLGDSPEEVAESLADLGIQGFRENPTQCPISKALRSKLRSDFATVYTDVGTVAVDQGGIAFKVQTTTAVDKFIQRFDDHAFPHLEIY